MSYDELMEKYKMLEQKNKISEQKNEELTMKIENLELEINSLRKMVFGPKRESTPKDVIEDGEQVSFFETSEEMEQNVNEQIEKNIEEITVYKRKNKNKKKAGIKKSELKDVVVERIEYEIKEDEACPKCGSDLKKVGKKVVRQEIEFEPAKFKIKEYVKNIYKCKKCGTEESENEKSTFVEAEVPNPIISHSFASPSLATEVIYQKYCLGVPLYRQEKMWDNKGLVLPRNMMANWNIKITDYYLIYLYKMMLKNLKEANELIHCDETIMQCNREKGRSASSKSYMWVMRSGELEDKKGVIFKYSPSRSEKVAKAFLEGYNGIIVTDGYAGYNKLEVSRHAECWAHARRYFYKSIPLDENKKLNKNAYGYQGVLYCDKLFKIEREIANLSVDEKKAVRQERSKPVLDEFYEWVSSMMGEKIVLNDKLNEALTYVTNQREALSEFLNDGRIPLTNSLAERCIRPFAVHRKNWLFADSVEGANANAVIYSIIESAKANNLNVHKYINYLLEELPQLEDITDEDGLKKYLPWSEELPENILNCQCTDEEVDDQKQPQTMS